MALSTSFFLLPLNPYCIILQNVMHCIEGHLLHLDHLYGLMVPFIWPLQCCYDRPENNQSSERTGGQGGQSGVFSVLWQQSQEMEDNSSQMDPVYGDTKGPKHTSSGGRWCPLIIGPDPKMIASFGPFFIWDFKWKIEDEEQERGRQLQKGGKCAYFNACHGIQ